MSIDPHALAAAGQLVSQPEIRHRLAQLYDTIFGIPLHNLGRRWKIEADLGALKGIKESDQEPEIQEALIVKHLGIQPGIIERENRKQENRLSVLLEVAKQLQGRSSGSAEALDESWIHFVDEPIATTTDAQRRLLWAQLIAREVEEPGSFSKRAVLLLRTMGPKEAELLRKLAPMATLLADDPDPAIIFGPAPTDSFPYLDPRTEIYKVSHDELIHRGRFSDLIMPSSTSTLLFSDPGADLSIAIGTGVKSKLTLGQEKLRFDYENGRRWLPMVGYLFTSPAKELLTLTSASADLGLLAEWERLGAVLHR